MCIRDRSNPEVDSRIVKAIQGVVFGQVVILVQDGKVTQIDQIEKIRLR